MLVLLTLAAGAWCAGQVVRLPADEPTTQPDRALAVERDAQPLSPEQQAEVLAFLKAEQPELFNRLHEVRQADEQRFQSMLAGVARTTRYLMDLKRANPRLYSLYKEEMQLSRQIDQLTRDVINAPMEKQSELVAELRGKLLERFDLVQERQKLLISQFQQKMDRLEQLLKTRQANREKIIEQDIQRIMDLAARRAAGQTINLNAPAPASQPGL